MRPVRRSLPLLYPGASGSSWLDVARSRPADDAALLDIAKQKWGIRFPGWLDTDGARLILGKLDEADTRLQSELRELDADILPAAALELAEAERVLAWAKARGLTRAVAPEDWEHDVQPVPARGEPTTLTGIRRAEARRKLAAGIVCMAEHKRRKAALHGIQNARDRLSRIRIDIAAHSKEIDRYERYITRRAAAADIRKLPRSIQMWRDTLTDEEAAALMSRDGSSFGYAKLTAAYAKLPDARKRVFETRRERMRAAVRTQYAMKKTTANAYAQFLRAQQATVAKEVQLAHPGLPRKELQNMVVKRIANKWRQMDPEEQRRVLER